MVVVVVEVVNIECVGRVVKSERGWKESRLIMSSAHSVLVWKFEMLPRPERC
jgi:hypothetical protein